MLGQSSRNAKSDLRILVVDDDHSVCRLLSELLTIGGYKAEVAHDGQEAIDAAAEEPFDVIFMDIKMPTSGLVAAEAILAAHPDTKIVMITGESDISLSERALQIGAKAVLMKPFSPDMVLDTMSMVQFE